MVRVDRGGGRQIVGTAERKALDDLVAEFARREVLGHIDEWEVAGELPRELHRAAGAAGLLGLGFPEELGGGGGHLDLMAALEGLVWNGVSTGVISALFSHCIALPSIVAHGTAEQREKFVRPTLAGELIGALAVTEPDGGSDVAALRTRAVRDGDHYLVNGTKIFITSGVRADFVTVAVRTGEPGHRGISLIVVERGTPGFTVSRKLDKMGWRSSDTAELAFADARVPVANLVGPENAGFRQIMEQFQSERLSMAVQCVAVARRCLDLTVDWVRERSTFGAPLASRQVVRHKIAEMARQTDVAHTYVWSVAARWAAGEEVSAEVSMAKNTAVYACEHVVHEAVQLHGGMGFMREYEVERHYRDIRVMGIGGGTNEIMNDVIAKRIGL
ncbi:acyl-CoA dehydrogenase family protein [Actinoallomurus purpureus]|uniref:acyl-CoA dehydrogenase family protein n=1 Tax=Actinoallomurus purpureus TaxID=478114 RepID=UPI0020920C94|nr:acyl-CoA dehydrogenase family protein [Actinoallomurus purpureus]MCO6010449.1 acyl-CoA dehydrogenase family protein [Actinoallomurus purpureus]